MKFDGKDLIPYAVQIPELLHIDNSITMLKFVIFDLRIVDVFTL